MGYSGKINCVYFDIESTECALDSWLVRLIGQKCIDYGTIGNKCTKRVNTDNTRPAKEGNHKKGGINPRPSIPKPNFTPPIVVRDCE
jgi:hypothetical protein